MDEYNKTLELWNKLLDRKKSKKIVINDLEKLPNFIRYLYYMAYIPVENVSDFIEFCHSIKIPTKTIKSYVDKNPHKLIRIRAIFNPKKYKSLIKTLNQHSYIDRLKYVNQIRQYMVAEDEYQATVNDLATASGRLSGIPKRTQIYYKKRLIKSILR